MKDELSPGQLAAAGCLVIIGNVLWVVFLITVIAYAVKWVIS